MPKEMSYVQTVTQEENDVWHRSTLKINLCNEVLKIWIWQWEDTETNLQSLFFNNGAQASLRWREGDWSLQGIAARDKMSLKSVTEKEVAGIIVCLCCFWSWFLESRLISNFQLSRLSLSSSKIKNMHHHSHQKGIFYYKWAMKRVLTIRMTGRSHLLLHRLAQGRIHSEYAEGNPHRETD